MLGYIHSVVLKNRWIETHEMVVELAALRKTEKSLWASLSTSQDGYRTCAVAT